MTRQQNQRLTNGSATDDVPAPQKKAKQQKKQKKQKKQAKEPKLDKSPSKTSLFASIIRKVSKARIFRRPGMKGKAPPIFDDSCKPERKKVLTKKIAKRSSRTSITKGSKGKPALLSRRSAPHMSRELRKDSKTPVTRRAASSPVLVKLLPTYVNRLKGCPFSLGEKLSNWCHTSPMALYDGYPPQDHFLDFPLANYRDIVWERQCDLRAAGHACTPLYDPAKRDEVVLERYAPGQHGLTPYGTKPACTNADVNKPSLPPPKYEERVTAKKVSRQNGSNQGEPPRRASAPADQRASGDNTTNNSRPAPITRVPTNCSIAARRGTMYDLNMLDTLNAIQEEDTMLSKN